MLIELLIVISIIGILSGIVLVSLGSKRVREASESINIQEQVQEQKYCKKEYDACLERFK